MKSVRSFEVLSSSGWDIHQSKIESIQEIIAKMEAKRKEWEPV
jgi:hypothetical protein